MSLPRFTVLVSGRGSNLGAILAQRATLGAELAGVISSVADVPALDLAARAGVEAITLVAERGQKRVDYDARLLATLQGLDTHWVVLAGFMRILSDSVVERYAGRIVNIHPSLLPAFPGMHPHRQAIETGVRFSGCTVHLVEPGDVDSGRILDQRVVPVYDGETEDTLAARVLVQEHQLYPAVLRRLFAGQAVIAPRPPLR